MEQPPILTRCGVPSKYDHAPMGAICKGMPDTVAKTVEVYVQRSSDMDCPLWELVGVYPLAIDDAELLNLSPLKD